MRDTRNEIINLANDLIRSVGYNAFSYADIAKKLNIKNATIHYYFPTKGDLGKAVILKNRIAFLEKTDSWKGLSIRSQLLNYITMHDELTDNYRTCIVGSLSPAFDTIPESMQHELRVLITTIIDWISNILSIGKERGEFAFKEEVKEKAYMIHAAMLSALLMNKVLKNAVYVSIQKSLLSL